MQKSIVSLVIIVGFVLLGLLFFGCTQPSCGNHVCDANESNSLSSNYCPNDCTGAIACTEEAKICPDGSAVGRTGPNCEFAPCPSTPNPPIPNPTLSGVCGDNHCDLNETAANCPNDCKPENLPYTVVIIHEESWAGTDEIIDLANQYNIPLTIEFWPEVVDYILASPSRIATVHSWQAQGHEIGMHAQGCEGEGGETCTGTDGNGVPAGECLKVGDAAKYEQLAAPYKIKSGISCLDPALVPSTYQYEASGYRDDGRSALAVTFKLGSKRYYGINVMAGYIENPPCGGTDVKISQYLSLKGNEIYGMGFHTADYAGMCCDRDGCLMEGDPANCPAGKEYVEGEKTQLKEWFKFLYEKDPAGVKRKTQSDLMEEYVIPNNKIFDIDQSCASSESSVKQCLQLSPNYHANLPAGKQCVGFGDKSWYLFKIERCLTGQIDCNCPNLCTSYIDAGMAGNCLTGQNLCATGQSCSGTWGPKVGKGQCCDGSCSGESTPQCPSGQVLCIIGQVCDGTLGTKFVEGQCCNGSCVSK